MDGTRIWNGDIEVVGERGMEKLEERYLKWVLEVETRTHRDI